MSASLVRASVLGATGYSGGELCAILARHPRARVASVFSSGKKDGKPVPFARLHPSLGGFAGPTAEPFSFDALASGKPDVVFLATPNETSAEVAAPILATGARVIDVSGAFRLRDAAAYPTWYGFTHDQPELLATTKNLATASHPDDHGDPNDIPRLPAIRPSAGPASRPRLAGPPRRHLTRPARRPHWPGRSGSPPSNMSRNSRNNLLATGWGRSVRRRYRNSAVNGG